nr:hypothetical protein [Tanacetum cinerariifolium]
LDTFVQPKGNFPVQPSILISHTCSDFQITLHTYISLKIPRYFIFQGFVTNLGIAFHRENQNVVRKVTILKDRDLEE